MHIPFTSLSVTDVLIGGGVTLAVGFGSNAAYVLGVVDWNGMAGLVTAVSGLALALGALWSKITENRIKLENHALEIARLRDWKHEQSNASNRAALVAAAMTPDPDRTLNVNVVNDSGHPVPVANPRPEPPTGPNP